MQNALPNWTQHSDLTEPIGRTSLFTVLTVINVLIPDLFWTHREYHPLVVALRKPVATSKVPSFVPDQTLCHSPAWVKPQRGQLATNVVDLKREINIVQCYSLYMSHFFLVLKSKATMASETKKIEPDETTIIIILINLPSCRNR